MSYVTTSGGDQIRDSTLKVPMKLFSVKITKYVKIITNYYIFRKYKVFLCFSYISNVYQLDSSC